MVQASVDDGLAECCKAPDVEGDIIVDEEDRTGAMVARVADVRQHPVQGVRMKVATAHRDDRAEAAVEGAAAGGLDHVDLSTQGGVPGEYPCGALRRANITALEATHRARCVVDKAVTT